MSKRIGILTSGGDCAGLNAVLRAVVRRVHAAGGEVVGIRDGIAGLMARPIAAAPLVPADVDGDGAGIGQGGTRLGTSNDGDPAPPRAAQARVRAAYAELGLDALIGVGGDGSLRLLRGHARAAGWRLIGVPKTIDNDVAGTDLAVGHASAVAAATDALDRLRTTAESHGRVMVLEVMGRDTGHIALASGIAGGADAILIPEMPPDLDRVAGHIAGLRRAGRRGSLVVVAEGVPDPAGAAVRRRDPGGGAHYGGIGARVGHAIAQATGAHVRETVLGHLQRGGPAVAEDRLLASVLGVAAADRALGDDGDCMVGWRNRAPVRVPLAEVAGYLRRVDPADAEVAAARGLGIAFGESGA